MRPLILLLTVLSFASAQEVFTPEHVAKIRTVTSAQISPNGERIAYVLNVPRIPFEGEDGGAWQELHVVDLEGNSRPFVTGEVNVRGVSWRSDSSAILFLAKRPGDEQTSLYSISVGGGEAQKLFEHSTGIGSYSTNGDQLAFIAGAKKDDDTEALAKAGFTQKVFEEDWMADQVWVADLSAEEPKAKAVELTGSAHSVQWNPAGDRLAVSLSPTPFVDDSYMNLELVYVDPSNGELHGGYSPPGKMDAFRWSPDGQRMAIVGTLDRSDPLPGRLLVASVETGEARDLMPSLEAHVSNIEWTAIDTVAYVADQGVWSSVGAVRLDGSGTTAVAADAGKVFGGLSIARNGAIATLEQSAKHPSEVAFIADGAEESKVLTNSNPWLADMRFAKQERVEYEARDGLRIEGVLIHPLDEEPGQRYPLILYVHGGPEAHEADGWMTSYSRPGQTAAARGMAVFYPNYRASTGRGVEFSKLDHGDFAGKEFDDLVDAIDHFAASGLVDPEKVGITGGSYGGYATAWASTALSERFAAGVMFVGISDQISKVGSTDIPVELFEVHHRKRIWDDWQFFLERSPIYHSAKAKTPLLILHGEEDTRVPTDQSLELYRLIKMQTETPVRLVLYPGEGHGNRRAASRYDYNLRMLRWMEHYLKGSGGDPPPYQPDYAKPESEVEASAVNP